MSETKTIPIGVVALRADSYSQGRKKVTVSLTKKYSTSERKYAVPIECFQDLLVDLKRLNTVASATLIKFPVQPEIAPNLVDEQDQLAMSV